MDEDEIEKTVKDIVYNFKKNGKPTHFKDHWDYGQKETTYSYDEKGRVEKVVEDGRNGLAITTVKYYNGYRILEMDMGDDFALKSTEYYNNKKQVLKEKTYMKIPGLGLNNLELVSRKIFNYNDRDSLFGIMEYHYRKGKINGKEKTIHYFHLVTNKKTKILDYDKNGELEMTVEYFYSKDNKLEFIHKKWH